MQPDLSQAIKTLTEIRATDVPWESMPSQFQTAFAPAEVAAYRRGVEHFRELAHRTGEAKLIELFEKFSAKHPFRCYIQTFGVNQPTVWFGLFSHRLQHEAYFRVANESNANVTLPERLKRFYAAFDGWQSSMEDHGGLVPAARMMSLAELIQSHGGESRREHRDYLAFYSFGNGDYVCSNEPGDVLLYNHETSELEAGDFAAFLDSVFEDIARPADMNSLFNPFSS